MANISAIREAAKYLRHALSRPYPKIHEEWSIITNRPGSYERLHGDGKSLFDGGFTTHFTFHRPPKGRPLNEGTYIACVVEGEKFQEDKKLFQVTINRGNLDRGPTQEEMKDALRRGYKESTGDTLEE